MSARKVMVGLGEVLWDFLPEGKVLGGAPANFAYMTTVLGGQGIVASRVGGDSLGTEALSAMNELGVSTAYVQRDDRHETGRTAVFLDHGGQPHYEIQEDVAWDFLEWTPAWEELSSRADAVCFGSLAQRSTTSAGVIERFLQNTSRKAVRICDANLRARFYTTATLERSFRYADIVKLNSQELSHICHLMEIEGAEEAELARRLLHRFDLDLICITRGARGSLLLSRWESIENPGISIEVADAVGAGDAFTACVAHYYLLGRPLEEISVSANRLAAWLTTQRGATPAISQEELLRILGDGNEIRK